MSSPFIPCPLQYNDFPAGGSSAAIIIAGRNPSDSQDLLPSGYLWLSDIFQGGSGSIYVQSGNSSGSANWSAMTAGSSALNTLSDGSNIVSPSGSSNIAIEGTVNQITSFGDNPSSTITFSIPVTFIAPGSIQSTSTLTVGTDLTVNNSATITNDLTVTDDVTIGGNLAVTGTITFGGISVDGTVAFNTAGAGTTTIGNAAAGAITFDVGTGNFIINGGGNAIQIGDDAAANAISIGNDTAGTSVLITSGTGDVTIKGAVTGKIILGDASQTGLITVGRSTAGQDIDIGSAINTSAQVIDIGNGASGAASTVRILSGTGTVGAATILLGNNPRVTVASLADVAPEASRTTTIGGGTVVVAAVTDTIDIGPDGATTNANSIKTVNVNTGGVTLGQVLTNIASGAVTSGTHTTSIASGNRAAGTMLVNLLTGTGTKSLAAGNADGGTTFGFKGIVNINASQNSDTAINSGTSTGKVTIGNSLAGAITVDTGAGISLDSVAASNFTVTGAADLTLRSTLGAVIVSADVNAARAIYLHANGGTSETIQLHSDLGTGVGSVNLLSDVGGITLRSGLGTADAINIEANGNAAGGLDIDAGTGGVIVATTGAVTLGSAAASNFTVTGAFALTLASTAGAVIVNSGIDAVESIYLHANGGTSETIRIRSDQGTSATSVDIESDAGGISLVAGLSAANAIVINASGAAGGVDISTGGGSVDISSAGFVTMVPVTDTQGTPSAASTLNVNVGAATFTGFTTASSASQVFTITNALISTSSKIFVSVSNEGANDAQMTLMRVKRLAGSMEVTTKNNGAAALNGNVTVNFWVFA